MEKIEFYTPTPYGTVNYVDAEGKTKRAVAIKVRNATTLDLMVVEATEEQHIGVLYDGNEPPEPNTWHNSRPLPEPPTEATDEP